MEDSTKREIDRIQEAYQGYEGSGSSGKWSLDNPGNAAMERERAARLGRMLADEGIHLSGKDILDFGCGEGKIIGTLCGLGAEEGSITGVDLQRSRLASAARRFPRAAFLLSDGTKLPFVEHRFDVVTLFTVFSSILDEEMTRRIALELARVLKPGGAILFYDFHFNNPSNPNVRGVTRRRIRDCFPAFEFHFRTLTLLPPLARRLGKACEWLYPALSALPFLRTHTLGLFLKSH